MQNTDRHEKDYSFYRKKARNAEVKRADISLDGRAFCITKYTRFVGTTARAYAGLTGKLPHVAICLYEIYIYFP